MSEEKCPTPKEHQAHMCQLKSAGRMEEIDLHLAKPTVVCGKCGARADEGAYLCNPRPL